MNAATTPSAEAAVDPSELTGLETRLSAELEGEVRFDDFTRGLYSTDASHYQIQPLGVVFPASVADVEAAMTIAREEGVPVLPRGAGTSQCGQTIGRAVVVDVSRHLTGIAREGEPGAEPPEVVVEPGVVLERLNRALAAERLWYPIDPATGNRATLGGMAGNNSAGARSLRYGMMADNVQAVEALLPDGRKLWLGEGGAEREVMPHELAALRALYAREAEEIERRAPLTMRDVAGYRLGALRPDRENVARLLVGSEGTLAFFTKLRLRLSPLPAVRALGVCHFPTLFDALDAVRRIVSLEPSAVELVDRNVLRLAAERPEFRTAMARFVRGTPGALLLVEFSSEVEGTDLGGRLDALEELLGDLGFPGTVVRFEEAAPQADVWSVRKAGLNIVMSMAGPRKPVSFIEDCAVPLEHLAEYSRRVSDIFSRHGAEGTWYAHASVGCLHVRPALNLKDPDDVTRMRAIAEETHEVVREFRGTHSGEHGDGILRSEFLEPMLGSRLVEAFREVKRTFDPLGMMNPGKIVDPPRMDDRRLLRYAPGYAARDLPVVLDWSADGGPLGHAERCNNNGACRKSDPGVMCPSYRVTGDERHSTRGRANALRLALTGQLGDDGLDGPDMAEALSLCISCKGCKRECPTGVDMARLKLEWQHRRNRLHGVPLRERVLAGLPRMAPHLSRASWLLNTAGRSRALRAVGGRALGLSADRPLPRWSPRPWSDAELAPRPDAEVLLFVDTFSRWFDPEVARAAAVVLDAGGWRAGSATPASSSSGTQGSVPTTRSTPGRPLCCGRTWLSAGMLDEARVEARRLLDALAGPAREGAWIVGLEPSCLLTLRDEIPALSPGPDAEAVAARALLLEELLERDPRPLPFAKPEPGDVLVHGHCHQKAFGATGATVRVLARVPELRVGEIASGCCGMAGAFGYHAEHRDLSAAMAELELLPAVRDASPETRIVADGTSCRAQIRDLSGRRAVHAAVVLAEALGSR